MNFPEIEALINIENRLVVVKGEGMWERIGSLRHDLSLFADDIYITLNVKLPGHTLARTILFRVRNIITVFPDLAKFDC